MKKMFLLALMLVLIMITPSLALDVGYSLSESNFGATTGNVTSNTDSFHAVGVLGSGSASGGNYAGGQAVTTHIIPTVTLPGVGSINQSATQNFGSAIGGFDYSIQTGNKNFLFFIPPMAGAIAGTKGDVSQWSSDGTSIFGTSPTGFGTAGSFASQGSGAGFVGADADLLIGKNKGPITGLFTGESEVGGYTYSNSWKGIDGNTKYVGTESGAGNYANTIITGGIGCGYAYGSGQTSGQSQLVNTVPGYGSTSGMYSGQFSYQGNGFGNVAGYSQSYGTAIPNGAVFGTRTAISVNVGP